MKDLAKGRIRVFGKTLKNTYVFRINGKTFKKNKIIRKKLHKDQCEDCDNKCEDFKTKCKVKPNGIERLL